MKDNQVEYSTPGLERVDSRKLELPLEDTKRGPRIDQKLIDSIRDNNKDYLFYPESVDKSLCGLYVFTNLRSLGRDEFNQVGIFDYQNLDELIVKEFQTLKERMKIEEVSSNTEYQNLLLICEQDISSRNFSDAARSILILKRVYQSINVQELLRLIASTDKAANESTGKDLYLFIGETGAGKSTAVHYLAGSKFEDQVVNGLPHLGPDPNSIKNEALKKISTSPNAQLNTRHIHLVDIELNSVGNKSTKKPYITLVDSPGFGDTDWPEVYLACGRGLINAIKNANSVTPLLVISEATLGNKLNGLIKLGQILINMMKDFEYHLDSFDVLFIKFRPKDFENLHAKIGDLINGNKKHDKTLIAFLRRLLELTEEPQDMLIVQPKEQPDPKRIIKKLLSINPITEPSKVFQTSFSEFSKDLLLKQSRQHHACILSAIPSYNIKLIQIKLDELIAIMKINGSENSNEYNESKQEIIKYYSEVYSNATSMIKQSFSQENTLTKADLENFMSIAKNFELIDLLRKDHIKDNEIKSSKQFEEFLVGQHKILHQLLDKIFINDKGEQLSVQEIIDSDIFKKDFSKIESILTKLSLTSEILGENLAENVKNHNQTFLTTTDELIKMIPASFEKKLEVFAFDDVANIFTIIDNIEENIKVFLSSSDLNIEKTKRELQEKMMAFLNSLLKETEIILGDPNIKLEDFEKLDSISLKIDKIRSCHKMAKHIEAQAIVEIKFNYYEQIKAGYKKLVAECSYPHGVRLDLIK